MNKMLYIRLFDDQHRLFVLNIWTGQQLPLMMILIQVNMLPLSYTQSTKQNNNWILNIHQENKH